MVSSLQRLILLGCTKTATEIEFPDLFIRHLGSQGTKRPVSVCVGGLGNWACIASTYHAERCHLASTHSGIHHYGHDTRGVTGISATNKHVNNGPTGSSCFV